MDNEQSRSQESRYAEALDLCRGSVNEESIRKAEAILEELGGYRDSAVYLEKCRKFLAHQEGCKVTFGCFEGKDLVWTVMEADGTSRLLLLDGILGYVPFNTESVNTDWNSCSLRKWLNREFLEKAFTLKERMSIIIKLHENDYDIRWKDGNGPATKDKVFVFSPLEAETYFHTDEERANGEWWWLRGHGDELRSMKAVYTDGSIYGTGVIVNTKGCGVRPALWVRVSI